nr:hypothetical protein [Tanacetum cinerariifolium]
MIELRADVELKDTIVVAMPKLVGEGFYMCTIRVEYEWKPPRCLSFKVFGHVLNECPKKIITDVVKNLNNPRQTTRGVSVGPKAEASRQEVSNSNPFDAFNSIENDYDLGTNEGISKWVGKGSLNVVHGSSSNAPIIDKIGPTCFKGESDIGYGTNSMWEPWRETKQDDDYDPYDDDLYETHDMPYHLQAICDDLDISVHVMLVRIVVVEIESGGGGDERWW